jgi:hypothetical protein
MNGLLRSGRELMNIKAPGSPLLGPASSGIDVGEFGASLDTTFFKLMFQKIASEKISELRNVV